LRLVGVAGCLVAATVGAAPADSQALSDSEKEEFLLHAPITSRHSLGVGITESERATLSDGTLTHDAHIQTIDTTYRRYKTRRRTYVNLSDSYKFNIAAYRLDRLLDLSMVPVSVERSVAGKRAAVTWWVDDVLLSPGDPLSKTLGPPDIEDWNDQMHQARVFTQLIYNTDPNLGNFLITTDFRVRMVDFTRAFRTDKRLQEPELIQRIDRRVYNGLLALTPETLARETKDYLTGPEMRAVIARRDRLVDLLETRIAAQGEAAVICDLPGH
jgi:hypothetical protein